MLDLSQAIHSLEVNGRRLAALVSAATPEQARWKPDPTSWSLLEVVNHLYDEERSDFRVRLDIILHRPHQEWPAIDPVGWVEQRRYNERELGTSIQAFLAERERSLLWLRGLQRPQWDAVYQAPWGKIRAGDMLAAWVAHDLLHMRQCVELHWAYLTHRMTPYRPDYAGGW
ncbi:MAG: DinB family protein [Caldilineae bacterium]|nr:MAG: DinB family protein [Caldilineae bacterium]